MVSEHGSFWHGDVQERLGLHSPTNTLVTVRILYIHLLLSVLGNGIDDRHRLKDPRASERSENPAEMGDRQLKENEPEEAVGTLEEIDGCE